MPLKASRWGTGARPMVVFGFWRRLGMSGLTISQAEFGRSWTANFAVLSFLAMGIGSLARFPDFW